jgi:hypothetical protein
MVKTELSKEQSPAGKWAQDTRVKRLRSQIAQLKWLLRKLEKGSG